MVRNDLTCHVLRVKKKLILGQLELSLFTFMELLTDWQLVFHEEAIGAVLRSNKRFSHAKTFDSASISIWRKESPTGIDLRLLARVIASNKESNDVPWLSTSCEYNPLRLSLTNLLHLQTIAACPCIKLLIE